VVIKKVDNRVLILKTLAAIVIMASSFVAVSQTNISYAQIDCDYTNLQAPRPTQILCPIIRLVNMALLVAGAVFILILGFGAIKMSLSLGDPKAFQSSHNTILFAGIGAFIVLGAFTIFFIINRTLGLGLVWSSPADIYGFFGDELRTLLISIGIQNP
jgi:hypothetical protein